MLLGVNVCEAAYGTCMKVLKVLFIFYALCPLLFVRA